MAAGAATIEKLADPIGTEIDKVGVARLRFTIHPKAGGIVHNIASHFMGLVCNLYLEHRPRLDLDTKNCPALLLRSLIRWDLFCQPSR